MSNFREATNPFGQYLQDWMLNQRPNWTTGQVARYAGVTRSAVWTWLYADIVPSGEAMIRLAALMGRPLSALYEAAGRPLPSARSPRHKLPQELSDAYWDWWIADTVEIVRAGMRREGIDERKIEQALQEIVADMRRRQKGKDYVPYVEREFATPSPETIVEADQRIAEDRVDYADQPTQTLQQVKPTKPSSSERRAPRRRETAKPKTQS